MPITISKLTIYYGVEKRHECRQDKANPGEKKGCFFGMDGVLF
jgi:hypothetical protein